MQETQNIICPICNQEINASEYLHNIFMDDTYAEWAANLITHYRHYHIKYYDRSWRNSRYRNRNPTYTYQGHDEFKRMVNNRAKRVLIRAVANNFSKDVSNHLIPAFYRLKDNEDATNNLIHTLTGLPIPEQVIEPGVPEITEYTRHTQYMRLEERIVRINQKGLCDFI